MKVNNICSHSYGQKVAHTLIVAMNVTVIMAFNGLFDLFRFQGVMIVQHRPLWTHCIDQY